MNGGLSLLRTSGASLCGFGQASLLEAGLKQSVWLWLLRNAGKWSVQTSRDYSE